MKVLDYILMIGVSLAIITWYMPIVLNTFGRVTGIFWMIHSFIAIMFPFLLKDYREKKLKEVRNEN